MNALLLQALLSLTLPLGAAATAQSAVEEVPAQETQTEQTIGIGFEENGVLSAAGLVSVGGAGAVIIAHNSKKKKNEPSAEISIEQTDDYNA